MQGQQLGQVVRKVSHGGVAGIDECTGGGSADPDAVELRITIDHGRTVSGPMRETAP